MCVVTPSFVGVLVSLFLFFFEFFRLDCFLLKISMFSSLFCLSFAFSKKKTRDSLSFALRSEYTHIKDHGAFCDDDIDDAIVLFVFVFVVFISLSSFSCD